MNTTLVYWIFGIIISILIGFWGIWYTRKTRRYTSISFVEKEFLPLFKTIIKNLNFLEIKYKGIPISDNLVLIKASLVNTGNVDIDKSKIFKPITISLPNYFRCIEIAPTEKSKDINVNLLSDNNTITIEWDLFKQNEFISFDLLVEVVTSETIPNYEEKRLSYYLINHRIADLTRIEKYEININRSEEQLKVKNRLGSLVLPSILFLGGLFLILFVLIEFRNGITYILKEDGVKKKFRVTYFNDTTLKLTSKIDTLNFNSSIVQLQEKFLTSFNLRKANSDLYKLMVLGSLSFLGGLILFVIMLRTNPKTKIYKILKYKIKD